MFSKRWSWTNSGRYALGDAALENVSISILAMLCGLVGAAMARPACSEPAGRVGLVLEYRFEGNAADSSGNKHDGTIHGNPRFVAGRVGQCLALDGQKDYIDCHTALADAGQTFTVECWVNPAESQNSNANVFGNHFHGAFGVTLEQDGGNTNRFAAHYGAGSGKWVSTRPLRLIPGRWQHVAVVKTSREMRLYLNGIPTAIVRDAAPLAVSPITFRIGQSLGETSRCFRGMIDDFRIWNKAIADFRVALPPREMAEALAEALSFVVTTSPPIAPLAGEEATVMFAMDESLAPLLPGNVNEIVLSFQLEDVFGNPHKDLPQLTLTRESGFRGKLVMPAASGCYHLTYRPAIRLGAETLTGPAGTVTLIAPRRQGIAAAAVVPEDGARLIAPPKSTQVLSLDGPGWSVATDPDNLGRRGRWFEAAVRAAKPTRVPWVLQDVFPEYHGVAWYWRDFAAPQNPHPNGRYLLRFHAVDYAAEVWVNGVAVGGHSGGETPFVIDVTQAVRPNTANRLAVRVLNPTHEALDGMTLGVTPHGCKNYPVAPGGVYSAGGIVDSVELLTSPAVRVEDLFVRPDPKSGAIRVDTTISNASEKSVPVLIQLAVAAAAGGPTLDAVVLRCQAVPGDTSTQSRLVVSNPRPWDLNDPCLYRVTARVWAENSGSLDERSVRCGFREFRFENGYFRLNGRRILPRGPLNLILYPVGFTVPPDPDYLRRDVLAMKAMGMNICRACFGGMTARQLDIYDELGVMVYMENYGSWLMQDSPNLEKWFDRALAEIIVRDRNHPSVVAWGLLNETPDGRLFRHAVSTMPMIRYFDNSRMVVLSSGRWDNDDRIGSLSNPGSSRWESALRDHHSYPAVPHTAETIRMLRTLGTAQSPMLLSEYGTGNAINLPRYARHYEQLGAEHAEDARYYRDKLDKFMADWTRWRLADCWARPEDFFAESDRTMAGLRRIGENAVRANPNLVGHFFCAIVDSDFDGCGVLNSFRELKPGSTDVMADVWAPLRWCVFTEPAHVYRGARVQLEAVLANEDVLRPGEYPVRVQVVGPEGLRVFQRTITAKIPDPKGRPEPSMALPVFSAAVPVDGPSGKYRFLVTFERGAAAAGGEAEFYVTDPVDMPAVEREVVHWGDDPELVKWLTDRGARVRPFAQGKAASREIILAGLRPPPGADAKEFGQLAERIAGGSTAVFLCPAVFARGSQPTGWLPLAAKGAVAGFNECGGYYRGDAFAKRHPIFAGLPCGGILDYTFYREIIPQVAWCGLDEPGEVVAGAIRATLGYGSGLLVSVHDLGDGRLILNTLRIRENLGRDPVAERLLRNMLNYAARDREK